MRVNAVLAVIIASAVAVAAASAYYATRHQAVAAATPTPAHTHIPGHPTVTRPKHYCIRIYYDGRLVKTLTVKDLRRLKSYSFVDSRGHLQEGPRLADVIKYALGVSKFKYVVVAGLRGCREVNLSYAEVVKPSNYIILDYTSIGTVKLCGNEHCLPRSEWVKDVVKIEVYG